MEEKDLDNTFSISVMHVVNTGKLWVSEPPGKDMSGQRHILQELEENLGQLMCRTFEMPFNLPVNKLIAVKNDVTGCWHRGELLSPRPTSSSCKARVFLVDHGAILVDVEPKHLQILPQEMHELPKQAFIVCLYGLIPISITVHLEDTHDKMHYEESVHWTHASETLLRKYLKFATSAHLRAIECRGHVVHGEVIFYLPREGYISINEELIKNNFAIRSEAQYKKVIEREARLEERIIEKMLKENEEEEKCSTPPKSSSVVKPILMEEFLKEYTNKKMLRQELNIQFLDSERYKKEMGGCKVDDEKTREALKAAILASKVKTSGRGENLTLMKENIPVISVGRGLPLLMEGKKLSSPQKEDSQKKKSSFHNLFDILSKNNPEDSEESTSYQIDSSVISLGRIPAGFSSQFEDIDRAMDTKPKKVTKKKRKDPYSGISSTSCKSSSRSSHNGESTNQLRGFSQDVSSDVGEYLDPECLLESKKTLSSKGPCASISFACRETNSKPQESSKETVTTTKANASPVAPGSKIMKLLLSLNRNSHEENPDVITKDVDLNFPDNNSSTIQPDISHKRPPGNDLFCKENNDNSVELKSQSLMLNDLKNEEKSLHFSESVCNKKEVDLEPSKKKMSNPLQSLIEAFRKKDRDNKDKVEEEPSTSATLPVSVPTVLSHVTNKKPVSARVKNHDNSMSGNGCQQPVTSFFKRSIELLKPQSPEEPTSIISKNVDEIEDTNKGKVFRDDTDVVEDSCPKFPVSVPPALSHVTNEQPASSMVKNHDNSMSGNGCQQPLTSFFKRSIELLKPQSPEEPTSIISKNVDEIEDTNEGKVFRDETDVVEDSCPKFPVSVPPALSHVTNEQPASSMVKNHDNSMSGNGCQQPVTSFFKRSIELLKPQSPEEPTSIISKNVDEIEDTNEGKVFRDETDVVEDSCPKFPVSVPPALSHVTNEQPASSVVKNHDNSMSGNGCQQPLTSFFKRSIELLKPQSPEEPTSIISKNVDEIEDTNEGKVFRDETDVVEDSCSRVSSDPDQLKAALDLISSFISSMETKDSEQPPVDLIRLRRELNTFSQHVISKKTNEIDVPEHEISSPVVTSKSEKISEDNLKINTEKVVDLNSEENSIDCIESFNSSQVMIKMPKLLGNSNESTEVKQEMSFKETQEEPKKILEHPQNIEINHNIGEGSFKLEDTVKETLSSKHNESPENLSGIEETVSNGSQSFSLLSFFPENKHTVKDDVKNIENHSGGTSTDETSTGTSKGNVFNETASTGKSFLENVVSCENEERRLDVKEVEGVVQESEIRIFKDIKDPIEMNNESDISVPLEKNTLESKPLDDDQVSKNIISCSKILQEREQIEKNKCLQIIKDEGIPMDKLSARLPASAALNILKRKGPTPVSSANSDNNSASSTADEDSVISKQKILEPEVITPSVHKDDLPAILKDSWLSGDTNDDCLFTNKRQKMCRVLVRGRFLAQRITSIAQATFPKSLHQALASMRYRDPMRIQTYAWPALMRGHDLVMVNPPRSGKTLGYLVPLLGFMLSPDLYSELPAGNGPLVLIICPSWKVVSQVNEFCEILLSDVKNGVRVIPTYGGIEAEQTISLINGCHVLISTPRSFLRLLKQDRVTTSLERLCHLVFDDADMLMKLFFPEVKEILRECRLMLQRRARISAELNPPGEAASYTMLKLVAASKTWCPEMESFVTNIIDKPVIFIGSYLEAAVYSQLKPKLHLVGFGIDNKRNEQEKLQLSEEIIVEIDDIVLHIIKRRVGLYKIVVACETKTEALQLAPKISDLGANVLVIHEDVLHVDITEAINTWTYSKQPGAYPVLIVTDGALPEVDIGDAEHLIHVGIPSSSKTQFGLRFATLMDNYRDILDKTSDGRKGNKNCFVDIIVDINKPDLEMAGLIEFMQRLGMEIPEALKAAATKSLLNKERVKKKDVDLCPNLKSFGECSESFCNFRHVISPEFDQPREVPQSGEVIVKVLHVLDASHMSVRLLEHIDENGCKTVHPSDYYIIAAQLAQHFGKSQNQVAHGNPEVGDLCAYESEINLFHRARVEKVFYSNSRLKIPVGVSINLIDVGINVKARIFQLYYLPDNMKEYSGQAKELIVANMLPRDLDSSWSKAACVKVAEWIEEESRGEANGKIIIAKIILALGNTIWVDPLECKEWLINNKTNVIHLSLPLHLCQAGLAIKNPEHVNKIKKICEAAGMSVKVEISPKEEEVSEADASISEIEGPKTKIKSDLKVHEEWGTLDQDKVVEVHVVDVESPSCFTVQKVDAEEKLKDLMEEIQLWISNEWQKSASSNVDKTREYSTNSFCLGYFERDKCWNRAKVLSVLKTSPSVITNYSMDSDVTDIEEEGQIQYKLYFLDFGDSVIVSSSDIAPIPENFIVQLPFQAIECSLFGVKPPNKMSENDSFSGDVEDWNEEAGDAFYALCRVGDDLDIYRILLAKVFESSEDGAFGGSKYSVALFDKGGNEGPTSLSKLLIEKGLASSCRTDPEDEEADESEALSSHWLGEGALLPFTPSLDVSTVSEVGTETPSVTDSSDALTDKQTIPSLSESGLLSSNEVDEEDDDDGSYDIVMSDDDLKMYEERLRDFLGIPPRPAVDNKTENNCLAIEGSATIEESSSYDMLTPNEEHSSFTSFEDLGDCFQKENDRFEEIFDESPEAVNKPERIDEGKSGDDVEVAIECFESVDSKELVELDALKSDCLLDKENVGNLEESSLSVKSECKEDEDVRDKTSHDEPSSEKKIFDSALEVSALASVLDDLCLEIKNPTTICDNVSESQLGSMETPYSNSEISEKVLQMVQCSSESDSFVRPNDGLNKFFSVTAVDATNETEIDTREIERNDTDICAQSMVPVKADSLNLECKVDLSDDDAFCDNIAINVKVDDEIAESSNLASPILTETLDANELTNTKDSADSLEGKHVVLSSKLSEVNRIEEDGTVITDSTVEYSVAVNEVTAQRSDDNHQVEESNNGRKNFQSNETLKEVGGSPSLDLTKFSEKHDHSDAEGSFIVPSKIIPEIENVSEVIKDIVPSEIIPETENVSEVIKYVVPSEIILETENVSEVIKEGNDDSDRTETANTSLDVTDITDEICDCSNQSCVHKPNLLKAKTPSVKWVQTKVEIILTIDVPQMVRYQVHWMSNRKLHFFAITDTAVESRYSLEMELWGYVDSQNSQIAATSDNSVKMILPKSFTGMEWPHLLLSGIRPLWLSVDFDAMEFDSDENLDEDPLPVVNYNESDEEYDSDEDADSIDGQRHEETNYDPYDPFS